jgi:DNA-binding MarR family transcriptional regulator
MKSALSANERTELLEVAGSCLCFKARKATRALTRFYHRHLAGTGLEPTQFNLLVGVRLCEPVPLVQLAERLGLERTTFTRNLRVLQREGLVEAEKGADRRRRMISLTAAGRQTLAGALPRWKEAQAAVISVLGEKHYGQLANALLLPTDINHED